MKLLKNKQQGLNENAKYCCICREMFGAKYAKDKNYGKLGDFCIHANIEVM